MSICLFRQLRFAAVWPSIANSAMSAAWLHGGSKIIFKNKGQNEPLINIYQPYTGSFINYFIPFDLPNINSYLITTV